MLENTFCHAPGIGPKTERRLWDAGLLSWDDVLNRDSLPLGPKKAEVLKRRLDESATHLEDGDPAFFYQHLPSSQQWRLFPHFSDSVAYFDIETTGLRSLEDYITTIVLYDGESLLHYVQNDNLWQFNEAIEPYQLIVTYNGKSFDAPFVRNYLGGTIDHAHIDLRYVLGSLGYRGGLKGCEQQLGIARDGAEEIDGFFAVLLWFDFYRNGNEKALETLLAYNAMDVVNLETLMVMAYNLQVQDTPFADSHQLAVPVQPEIPFAADSETIGRIRREVGW
jgi:hypothetical protein